MIDSLSVPAAVPAAAGTVLPAGPPGPAAWAAAVPWAPNTAYSAAAPLSVVTYAGGCFVCATSHTSGASFDATKWTQVAYQGSETAAALTDVVSALKAVLTAPDLPTARAALGLAIGSAVQAWDADLDAIAAQGTAAFGRSLLTQPDAPTALGALGGAPALSPNLQGTPTAPTAPAGTSTTQLATTAFVAAALAALLNGAPAALDTLKELADAINDDANFAATVTTALAGKATVGRQILTPTAGGLQGGGTLGADLSLAIAAGGVANAMLGQVPAYTLKANLLASTASPQDVSLTALIDGVFGNTRGALLYRGASGWAVLPPGSTGQVLTSNGTGADPSYAAAAAAASYPNVGVVNGLTIRPGSTASTQIALSAAAVLLKGSSAGLPLQNVSATISTGTVGANGLDTGTLAASTWYALYGIAKPDGTFAGLLSLSATAPTLPSGYTYALRMGWQRTDASKNLVPIIQNGRQARYKADGGHTYPVVVSGAVGDVTTPTFQAVAVSGFAPSTAIGGLFATYATSGSNTIALLAPNASYGSYNQGQSSGAPPPPVNTSYGQSSASGSTGQQTLHFESANVYAACQSNAGIVCLGWDDNLCA